jgi:F-type H+-transporting ATPase subunit epsilon
MDKFKLEILTPNGEIFNDEVLSVVLPGEEGEFGVLAGHASLTTLLEAGVVDVEKEDKTVESIVINWGVVQVDEEKVIILLKYGLWVICQAMRQNGGNSSNHAETRDQLIENAETGHLFYSSISSNVNIRQFEITQDKLE